jgi:hypothetical protein
MATLARKGTITAATTNGGSVFVDLSSAGFSTAQPLRAIFFMAIPRTATGVEAGDESMTIGWATNYGGTIQQEFESIYSANLVDPIMTSHGRGDGSAARFYTASTTPTIGMDMDVTAFGDDDFTVVFSTAPASAWLIHYMALGGTAFTHAYAFRFAAATNSATQTVGSASPITTANPFPIGFGQPDMLFLSSGGSTTNGGNGNAIARFGLGVSKSATVRTASQFLENHNQATANSNSLQIAKALISSEGQADLSDVANWPTDGFRLDWTTQVTTSAHNVIGLALRGPAASGAVISVGTAPTAAAPQIQDIALASPPAAALMWGTPLPTSATAITGNAGNLGGWFMGMTDMSAQGCCGFTSYDAATAASMGRFTFTDDFFRNYQPVSPGSNPPTIASAADSSISGDNLRLTWTDTDTVAREYRVVAFPSISVNDKTEALIENFSSALDTATKWTVVGGPTVTDGELHIPCTSSYHYIQSQADFDLISSHARFRVLRAPSGTTSEGGIHLRIDSNNHLSMYVSGADLVFLSRNAGTNSQTTVTYNPALHRLWQIREDAGTIYWETSSDGSSWTTQRSRAKDAFDHTDLKVQIWSGYYGTETTPGDFIADSLNLTDVDFGESEVTVLSVSRISAVASKDSTQVTFTYPEDFVEYQIRRVASASDNRYAGTQILRSTVTARDEHTVTITEDDLVAGSGVEGNNLLKIFVCDSFGNWSA